MLYGYNMMCLIERNEILRARRGRYFGVVGENVEQEEVYVSGRMMEAVGSI